MTKEWPRVHVSKKAIRRAGDVLRDDNASKADRDAAREVAKAWRSAHQYPVNTWQVRLRGYVKGLDALVAQRMKRISSIEKKLNRFENTQLDGMQDLGGVRVVVPTVVDVRRIEKRLLDNPRNHVLKNHHDYLATPKLDGYRSIHLVYAYGTKPPTAWDGYKVEIQLRTTLQHYWATALETVDLFTRQGLKAGEGEEWWREFFALMSSEIAVREGLPIVEGTPKNEEQRRQRLNELNDQHDIINRLAGFRHVVRSATTQSGDQYLLLDLDLDDETLAITGFSNRTAAAKAYAELETSTRENPLQDVVLVAVDDAKKLESAYPNYFINLDSFMLLAEYAMALKRTEEAFEFGF
jgi:hypothetical protein